MNYYNENDPKAAAWLKQLLAAGLIPPGVVDTRSISEIKAYEITEYTQHHFFAGIGGWSLALQLASVPPSRRIVTGSCPCQPFSDAGKHRGKKDKRHLWPAFRDLLAELPPAITFGEQVASKAGRAWLARVRFDLEDMAYQVGAADLCAASACPEVAGWIEIDGQNIAVSAGPPHIRQRLYWVAIPGGNELGSGRNGGTHDRPAQKFTGCGDAGTVANSIGQQSHRDQAGAESRRLPTIAGSCAVGRPAVSDGGQSGNGELQRSREQRQFPQDGGTGGVGHPELSGLEGHGGNVHHGDQSGRIDAEAARSIAASGGAWNRFDLLPCTDGKTWRVESGSFPLAHGIPGRVGLLRGYGNAIPPEVAAQFIHASLEAIG